MEQLPRNLGVWIRPHLRAWARLWRCPQLATVSCAVNPRLSASLGRCRPAARAIELNPRLLALGWRLRREVLCHEAAHLAVRELHGLAPKPHGAEWRELMALAGFRPRVAIPAALRESAGLSDSQPDSASSARAVRGHRYQHKCPVCQFTRMARRQVGRWRCAACVDAGLDGVLHITRVR